MSKTTFEILALLVGIAFAIAFAVLVLPPALQGGDIVAAFAAGFVNPFATGYSLDTILCGVLVALWIVYERSARGVRHGWIAIALIPVPGVATALGLYLFLRSRQEV